MSPMSGPLVGPLAWWARQPRWAKWCGGFLVLAVLVIGASLIAWLRRPPPSTGTALVDIVQQINDGVTAQVATVNQDRTALDQQRADLQKDDAHAQQVMQDQAQSRDAAHRAVDAAGDDVDRINAVLYGRRQGPG